MKKTTLKTTKGTRRPRKVRKIKRRVVRKRDYRAEAIASLAAAVASLTDIVR